MSQTKSSSSATTEQQRNILLEIRRLLSMVELTGPSTVQIAEPTIAPAGQEYVDPFLFESEYFSSREEYSMLSSAAPIKPRRSA